MFKGLSFKKVCDIFLCLALLFSIAFLIAFPQESISAAKDGIALCTDVIVPSLFPFFVLSALTVNLGYAQRLGQKAEIIMRPLFNVNGACSIAFILGIIGGYPVGARTALSLYRNNACTKTEAEHLLTFCNNSGPSFIFGVVGAGLFASGKIGLYLFIAHMLASISVGIIFRSRKRNEPPGNAPSLSAVSPQPFSSAFTEAVKSSFQSCLNICGFVIFFNVFIKMLKTAGIVSFVAAKSGAILSPLGITAYHAEKLITGAIELSTGIWNLKDISENLLFSVPAASFFLGWGGISIHCQTLSLVKYGEISLKAYIVGKFFHGVISAVFSYALLQIFPIKSDAFVQNAVLSGNFNVFYVKSPALPDIFFCLAIILLIFILNLSKTGRKF